MNTRRIAGLFVFLMGCAQGHDIQVNAVAFGDSYTQGDGVSQGYIYELATIKKWTLTNRAVGGTVLSEQLERIQDTDLRPYQVIVFLVGFNDMRAYGTDANALLNFDARLRIALEMFQNSGARVYVGNTMRMMPGAYDLGGYHFGSEQASQLYSDLVDQAVSDFGGNIVLVDMHTQFDPRAENMDGGIHPNPIGISEIANIFASVP